MDDITALSRTGITVNLDADMAERVRQIAGDENLSVEDHIRLLIERDLRTRDEAEQVIHVFVAPELQGQPPGPVGREEDESDSDYARRSEALDILFGVR